MNCASDIVNSWNLSNYTYTVTTGRAVARSIPAREISGFLKQVMRTFYELFLGFRIIG